MSWRERWRRFREWDRKGLAIVRVDGTKAYTKTGYVFERKIFRAYIAVVFLCVLWVILTSGVAWREFYVRCPLDGYGACENPFYLNCDREECKSIEHMRLLPRGFQIGEPPSEEFNRQVRAVWIVVFSAGLLAFLLNHRMMNKGKRLRDMFPELEVPE